MTRGPTRPSKWGLTPIRVRVLVVVLLAAAAFDCTRPPSSQLAARAALAGVSLYQATLSPLLGQLGVRCRFKPTCSHYAAVVIARDGIVRGSWLTIKRIARCGPWTPRGTEDMP